MSKKPPEGAWMPLDTAPKDGSTILLALASYGEQFHGDVWAAFWHDGSQNYWEREGWYDEADRCTLLTAKPAVADCWQPLPDPPKAETAAQPSPKDCEAA